MIFRERKFLDRIDEVLLSKLAQGLPLIARPFGDIAVEMGISSDEVLMRLRKLKQVGVVRRFGATIKPNDVGLMANAVVAWNVPADRVDEVGQFFASFREVTHCYERAAVQGRWEYSLYIVMHARERQVIEQMTKSLAKAIGIQDFVILYSKRDLKNRVVKKENMQ
jgi:DNA-binding Lrp family transcriptional regulator